MPSGTIVVNAPFELAVVVNMLGEPARSLVFHKPTAKSDAVEDALASNTRWRRSDRAPRRGGPDPRGLPPQGPSRS